jgi:predicted ATPase/class 3 adenylate cyclase
MSGDRPSGIVTFLFTDIEGSTRLWDERPDEMQEALARHDATLRDVIESHGGYIFATGGDGFAAAFSTPVDAVDAAIEGQRTLADQAIDSSMALRVRMGLHTGTAEERDGNYFGPVLNLAARIMSCAWGGQIVASAVCASLSDRSVVVTALGPVRLAGVELPVEVCQITPDGLGGDFPPLRTLDSVPNNLPRLRTTFVGRESEIGAIVDDLAAWPLVTLTGVGGVGKTRLSLQVAERALPGFRGGVYFVELAPVLQGSDVIDALIDVMKPPLLPGRDNEASLAEYLSSRQVLVVIDNCEHVIDSVADIVDQIIALADQTRILATSREGLGLDGERLRAVQPLKAGSTEHDGPAEQLFKVRLAASEPDLVLDQEQNELVRLICERLDGVPLALELAAARASTMGLAEILDRLQERFQLLRGGRRAVSERHQTLRNTVEWSHDLLNDNERQLFARLSVFAGTFGLDSVEQFCVEDAGSHDIAGSLGALVSKSMVEAVRVPSRPLRYRLLETLRQYAAERLDSIDDPVLWRNRHAEIYAQLVVDLGAALRSPDELVAMTRLIEEVPNIRAALLWASEADRPDLAAKLTGPTGLTLDTNQTFTALASAALECGAGADPTWGHGVLISEIWHCYAIADFERAEAALAQLDAIESDQPDLPALQALGAGVVAFTVGDFDVGIERFTAALEAAADADAYTQLRSSLVLAAYSNANGNPATQAAEFGLELARQLRVPTTLAFALSVNSMICEASDLDRALALVDEALTVDLPPGSISAIRHTGRGRVLFRLERWSEALPSIAVGVGEFARSGQSAEGSHGVALGAACLFQLGDTESGADLFRRSAAATDMQMVKLYHDIEEQAAALIGEPFPPDRSQPPIAFDELARRAVRAFDTSSTPN